MEGADMEQELAKYEGEGTPPEVVDLPRPPGRQRRHRSYNNIWELRKLKQLWLRTYRACGEPETACLRVGRDIRTLYRWLNADAAFKEEYLAIKKAWQEVTGEVLESLDMKAVAVVKEALKQTEDGRLRADIAVKVLRSHGYLVEKAQVEHVGEGGGPVKVIHTVEVIAPKEKGE